MRSPLLATLLIVLAALSLANASRVSAHAEPERASPPISGVVATAPAVVEIWFSEEVKTDGTTIQVIGPGGIQVDQADATVDLQDPDRKHVTVSLRSGLGDGVYTVQWHTVSGADGDEAQGGFIFTVGQGSPVASPVATTAPATPSPGATATVAATTDEENFDSRAFGFAVGAGLLVAVALFIFWRLVRPKQSAFRD